MIRRRSSLLNSVIYDLVVYIAYAIFWLVRQITNNFIIIVAIVLIGFAIKYLFFPNWNECLLKAVKNKDEKVSCSPTKPLSCVVFYYNNSIS